MQVTKSISGTNCTVEVYAGEWLNVCVIMLINILNIDREGDIDWNCVGEMGIKHVTEEVLYEYFSRLFSRNIKLAW